MTLIVAYGISKNSQIIVAIGGKNMLPRLKNPIITVSNPTNLFIFLAFSLSIL